MAVTLSDLLRFKGIFKGATGDVTPAATDAATAATTASTLVTAALTNVKSVQQLTTVPFLPDKDGNRLVWAAGQDAAGNTPAYIDSNGRMHVADVHYETRAVMGGTVPLFTFGAPFVNVDANGMGYEVQTANTASVARAILGKLPSVGNEGTRLMGLANGPGFDNSTVSTFQTLIETAQHFDAIRVVLVNSSASPVTIGKCSVSTRADNNPTDNNNNATWVPVTFGGSASVTLAAKPGNTRVTYAVSDWIPISSADRSDGGTSGVAIVRAYCTTAATISMGYVSSFTGFAAKTDGMRWMNRVTAGDCIATVSNFTSTTNMTDSPVGGLCFIARGQVVNLAASGDSITQAQADTNNGEGFLVRIKSAFHDPTRVAWSCIQLGWSGSQTASFLARWNDFVAAGLHADILMWCGGSCNDTGSGAGNVLTQAFINGFRQNRYQGLKTARGVAVPWLWTWGPYSATTYQYGATDSLRLADNAEIRGLAAKGILVSDFATVLATGGTTSGGQQVPNAALTNADLIHPNSAGYDALTVVAVADLQAYLNLT